MQSLGIGCFAVFLCVMASGTALSAASPPTVATAASTHEGSHATELGPVEVQGMRQIAEVLQQIKVAFSKPITSDPKHVDDMVCMIHAGRASGSIHNRTEAVLECGTNGWYLMRAGATQSAVRQGYIGPDAEMYGANPTLGHPWHIKKILNYNQLAALRKLLKEVPRPGQGTVKIVEQPH